MTLTYQRLLSMDMAVRESTTSSQLDLTLRWRVHPSLGLPRTPFRVHRLARASRPPLRPLREAEVRPAGTGIDRVIQWQRQPQAEIVLSVRRKGSGRPMTIQALDDYGEPIPGITAGPISELSRSVRLAHPNICELQITGEGEFLEVVSLPLQVLVDQSSWEFVEAVGLPFARNQVDKSAYDCSVPNQGASGHLVDGVAAARSRLATALARFQPPPTATPSKLHQPPAWNKPASADAILAEMSQAGTGPLTLISRMLVDTSPKPPYGNHARYRLATEVEGFRQPGDTSGKEPNPATLELDVMGLTVAAVTTDLWSAVALGFGTMVFPPKPVPPLPPPRLLPEGESVRESSEGGLVPDPVDATPAARFGTPAAEVMPEFDYMVTAHYQAAGGGTETWAAVAAPIVTVPGLGAGAAAPKPLSADTLRRHRPMVVDGTSSEDVQLRWPRLAPRSAPQAYALAICENGGPAVMLNQPRAAGGFSPYVPVLGGEGDAPAQATFIDSVRPVPLTGGRNDVYLCAATDVFGRWSDWAETAHTIEPDPLPAPPRILSAAIEQGPVDQVLPRAVHATLQLEWTMDWADRTFTQVEIVGGFFPVGSEPPGTAPDGFQARQVVTGNEAALKYLFNEAGKPSQHNDGTLISELPVPNQHEHSRLRRFKLTYPHLLLDYSAEPRLAFAVWIRAQTKVEATAAPLFSQPGVARANDPLPAPVPGVEPRIHWTALPDATGVGRARLVFEGSDQAMGYTVYEASESAIRAAAGRGLPAPGTSLAERRDLLLGTQENPGIAYLAEAFDAFARVNTRLLPVPEAEVALPEAIDGLYAYVITSTTAGQVESARSGVTLAAVPRRVTPFAPHVAVDALDAAEETGNGPGASVGGVALTRKVHVRVLPAKGVPTATVALHRIHSPELANDPDLMGPAVIARGADAWTVEGSGNGMSFVAVDTVEPSWRPYFYRAVAYGTEDPDNGRRAGRSPHSPVAELLLPPVGPPDLVDLVVAQAVDPALWRVTVRSDADMRLSPLGAHRLAFFAVDPHGLVPTEKLQAEARLPDIAPIAVPAVEAAGLIRRSGKDSDGRVLYEAFVPAGVGEIRVRLEDPLGRTAMLTSVPDLDGLQLVAGPRRVRLTVRSAAPVTTPPKGAFVLEVANESTVKPAVLAQARLHEIATSGGAGAFVRSGPDADGRFIYDITLDAEPGPVPLRVTLRHPLGMSINLLRASINVLGTEGEES